MMFNLHSIRKSKSQDKCKAFDNIHHSNNAYGFGDFIIIFYKSLIAAQQNKGLNINLQAPATKVTAEYYLEKLYLQYNTPLFNCEKCLWT